MNIEDVPRLKEFCQAMLEWIDGGCGDHEIFGSLVGLCRNHALFTRLPIDRPSDLLAEYFYENFNTCYPFGGQLEYGAEVETSSLYQNPERLQWLKDHAK